MKRTSKQLAKSPFFCQPSTGAALVCAALAFLIPLLVIHPQRTQSPARTPPAAGEPLSEAPEESTPKEEGIRVLLEGTVQTMPLEDYLWGVVAAEMPAAFEQEALNAQAIAARTYTLYRMAHPGDNHPEADICGDAACCQAWISHDDRMKEWAAKSADTYAKKITKAVESTAGQYLSYENEPILAAFHASSAGFTKSSLEVWGEDFPYLREVESPEETDAIPNYYSTVELSAEKVRKKLQKALPKADLTGEDSAAWFGEERFDEAGLPSAIQIGGVWVDTSKVRSLFDLRSASFTVEAAGDTVTFYVTGYGHGVGMSQYGANALAKQGKTAEEIVKWYYSGAKIETIQDS